MSKDYDKGFQDAVKKINDLLLSEFKTYKKEIKTYVKDTDFLSAYENKIRMEDADFYFHEFRKMVVDKTDSDEHKTCNCLICKED